MPRWVTMGHENTAIFRLGAEKDIESECLGTPLIMSSFNLIIPITRKIIMSNRLPPKDIFIAYADEDGAIARQLRETLDMLLGDRAWLRDFDMNGGEMISEALYSALSDTKWVIVLLSQVGVESRWISKELHYGAITSLLRNGVQFILVKCNNCEVPRHLEIPLRQSPVLNLSGQSDLIAAFTDIAGYIESSEVANAPDDVYEGRGDDTDKFKISLRRNRIVFVFGWRGIGKTAFVKHALAEVLRKRVLTIRLNSGSSLDTLARDIIRQTHVVQPIEQADIPEATLLDLALAALRDRARQFVLFIDDMQEALDGVNQLLPYLERFLEAFLDTDIETTIVAATTRFPQHNVEISKDAAVFKLGPLNDEYVEEILRMLMHDTPERGPIFTNKERIAKIVRRIEGHPIAAIRMAGLLKIEPLELLAMDDRLDRFQIGMATHILGVIQTHLFQVDQIIMSTLAVVAAPMTISDLLFVAVSTTGATNTQVQESIQRLVEWFLIDTDAEAEYVYLHGFMVAYFQDSIRLNSDLRTKIAESYGMYAYRQAKLFSSTLAQKYGSDNPDQAELAALSNRVYRYSLPADRLLRTVGRVDLADKLPIRSKGTLRSLVYYFYRDVRDYRQALDYAEQWLQANPNDLDIQLQRIKCYRRIGDQRSFATALQLIEQLEFATRKKNNFRIYLLRERALIAQRSGDREAAKKYFHEAIVLDGRARTSRPYSEIYAELARILLEEADAIPEWVPEHYAKAQEAVQLLEIAKKEAENFFRFHFNTYINALLLAGKEEEAIPLLEEALQVNPDDGTLNFRKAEIHRRQGDYDLARKHAKRGIASEHAPSYITYANTVYDEVTFHTMSDKDRALQYDDALAKLQIYKDKFSASLSISELEVAAAIMSKIYRAKGDLDSASKVIERSEYRNSGNPYTIYEQSTIFLRQAEQIRYESVAKALALAQSAVERIDRYPYELSEQLISLRDDGLRLQDELKRQLKRE